MRCSVSLEDRLGAVSEPHRFCYQRCDAAVLISVGEDIVDSESIHFMDPSIFSLESVGLGR
jgi:hypothetical protein